MLPSLTYSEKKSLTYHQSKKTQCFKTPSPLKKTEKNKFYSSQIIFTDFFLPGKKIDFKIFKEHKTRLSVYYSDMCCWL